MKRSFIEPLENRIAPAAILTFTDVAGDKVDVVSNKTLLASVSFTAGQNPAELLITGAGLDGANLAVLVKRAPTGDGVVNIGRIVATGLDLGIVSVKGDLGKIVCGNANSPLPAIKSLTVRSMGILCECVGNEDGCGECELANHDGEQTNPRGHGTVGYFSGWLSGIAICQRSLPKRRRFSISTAMNAIAETARIRNHAPALMGAVWKRRFITGT